MKNHALPGHFNLFGKTQEHHAPASKKHIWFPVLVTFLVIVILGLVAARLYLPYWVKDYVNGQISELHGYSGSVGDIDIALWRGAYQIHNLDIRKTNGKVKEPFVAADTIDISLHWHALLHGRTLSKVEIHNIALTFSKEQYGGGADWQHFVNSLTPFDINQTTIRGGKVAYVDHYASPPVNLYIDDIRADVANLRNVDDKEGTLPSTLLVTGKSIGKGALTIKGRGNIMRDIPDFALDIKLENAALPAFNNYTEDAAAIDFDSGTLSVYSEVAARHGHVVGYIKPIATNVNMLSVKQAKNPLQLIWKTLAAAFIEIFKNHPADQFALRIPIEGDISNPHENGWAAFLSIFQNAFGKAFPRTTDGSIDWKYALKNYNIDKEAKPKH